MPNVKGEAVTVQALPIFGQSSASVQHAMVRSTIHRLGRTTNLPTSERLTISTLDGGGQTGFPLGQLLPVSGFVGPDTIAALRRGPGSEHELGCKNLVGAPAASAATKPAAPGGNEIKVEFRENKDKPGRYSVALDYDGKAKIATRLSVHDVVTKQQFKNMMTEWSAILERLKTTPPHRFPGLRPVACQIISEEHGDVTKMQMRQVTLPKKGMWPLQRPLNERLAAHLRDVRQMGFKIDQHVFRFLALNDKTKGELEHLRS
jgi:hypothetical protein